MKKKILFVGIDAAMPDLLRKFTAEGKMPNFRKLMDQGFFSRVETVFPPLTAIGWEAIVCGCGCGEVGIPSLMVKLPGEELDEWHTSFDRRMNLAETLWDVGIKEGKKCVLVNWPVTFPLGIFSEKSGNTQIGAALNPPFRYFYMPLWDIASSAFFSTETHYCNQIPGRAVVVTPEPSQGWTNLPESKKTPLEFEITVPPVYVEGYRMYVLMYAKEAGYDHVLISKTKNAADCVTDICVGEWGPWITEHFTLHDSDEERNGRFRFKLISISEDGKKVSLYQTAINTADPYTVPASYTQELENAIGSTYMEVDDPWAYLDGWFPMEDYLDLIHLHANWWGDATAYTLKNREWDMAFTWVGTVDHMEHMVYGGMVSGSVTYDPETAPWAEDCIRKAYMQVDENLGKILSAVNLNETLVVAVSDHGFTELNWNVFIKEALKQKGLLNYVLELTNDDPSNLSIDWSKTKCHPLEPCHAHMFINLAGRDPHGIVDPKDYHKVQQEIIRALYDIKDPVTGESITALAITKEEALTLGITKGPGYDRVGDVLWAWKPGYMAHPFIYRAAVKYRDGSERMIPNSELFEKAVLGYNGGNFTGGHLCLPSYPGMHAAVCMAGLGMPHYDKGESVGKIIDIAPTVAKIIGIPVPKNAEGNPMHDVIDQYNKKNGTQIQ